MAVNPQNGYLDYTFSVLENLSEYMQQVFEEPKTPFESYHSEAIKTGALAWSAPRTFRNRFRSLYEKHVQEAFKDVCNDSTAIKVLELGAGFLKDGNSFLSSCLAEKDWIYSDLSPKIVEDANVNYPSVSYLQLDSVQIQQKIKKSSLDAVAASCFLDTLNKKDLGSALLEIASVLKKDGFLFHISDLEPFMNTLIIDLKDEPGIMFPLVNEDRFIKGIQFVPRKICEQWAAASETPQSDFLKKYIAFSNDVRAAIVLEICTMPLRALDLSKWAIQHFPSRKEVINEVYFNQRLHGALKKANFEILKFGLSMQQAYFQRMEIDEKEHNDFYSLHGRLIKRNIELPEGIVRKTLTVHLIAAKKL